MLNLFYMKTAVIKEMTSTSGGESGYSRLLDNCFTLGELRELKKHPDLMERILGVSHLRTSALKLYVEVNYKLNVDGCAAQEGNGEDFFVSVEKHLSKIPDFSKVRLGYGRYVNGQSFVEWAQTLVMSEIRMNVIIRAIEDKRKSRTFTSS